MKTTLPRLLVALVVALAVGPLGSAAWGQDGFGGGGPTPARRPHKAEPPWTPSVVPDGVYEGRMMYGHQSSQFGIGMTVEVRGTTFTAHGEGNIPGWDPPRHVECDLNGTYDAKSGKISGTCSGTPVTADEEARCPRMSGTFRGGTGVREVTFTGGLCDPNETSAFVRACGAISIYGQFAIPTRAPATGIAAAIHWSPDPPKPGDQVTVWADITDADGKPVTGARKIWDVLKYAGDADPRFTWDGKELPIRLTVIHDDNEYKFAKTLPAFGTAPATGVIPGLEGAGKVPGPASILSGIVGTLVPGIIGILGGLVGGLRRTAPPVGPRPPTRRPPPPPARRPPPPPARKTAKPPPPPPKRPPKAPHLPDEAARLKDRLDKLEKMAHKSGDEKLKKWVENTRKEAFNPDGSLNKEKAGEARTKLGEVLNIPPGGGIVNQTGKMALETIKGTIDGARRDLKDMGETIGDFGLTAIRAIPGTLADTIYEAAGGIASFVGGIVTLPIKAVEGLVVIGKALYNGKYILKGLDDMAHNWVNTAGAADRDAFRNAMKEGRYLDALGNLAKGVGNAGLALGGKLWNVAKEFLPVDEIASWFDKNASLEERLWSIPSGIAKTLGILMGFEGGRNLLSKPIPKLNGWSPLSTAAKGVEKAGTAAVKKWTEWRGPPKLPAEPPKLGGTMGKLQDKINDAINTSDEADRARKIEQIYRDGGMKELKKLQEAGGLSAKQAEALNNTITKTVNDTVDKSVRSTVGNFHKGTGVRIKEVIVADSGSSATGGARSIYTDADRTKLINFHPEDLTSYASKQGLTEAQAYERLAKMAQDQINRGVTKGLNRAGLSPNDVGYGSYRGLGSGAGPADAYPQSWTEQNTLRHVKATSYRPSSTGGVSSHQVGARQVIDEGQMIHHKYGGGTLADAPKTFGDSLKVLKQQAASIGKPGVAMDKVAKAVLRTHDETKRWGVGVDPKLLDVAKQIKSNPTSMKQILADNHLTEEQFTNWGRAAVKGANDWMHV